MGGSSRERAARAYNNLVLQVANEEVPREFKKWGGKRGGSSQERAAREYMQGNTQNIPIVNMYLAVLRTQRALIDPPFAASSQGMHGQTPLSSAERNVAIGPGREPSSPSINDRL